MKNKLFYIILSVSIIITSLTVDFNASQAAQTAVKQTKPAAVKTEPAITVAPSEVVKNPSKYLKKNITFSANFVSFTTLGLDYKPAFRDSSKYIGVLIQRDDVTKNVIPLSEMKILVLRDNVEKFVDLEQGDKIKITGTVFSTALSDPWVDVTKFEVLSQKNKKDK